MCELKYGQRKTNDSLNQTLKSNTSLVIVYYHDNTRWEKLEMLLSAAETINAISSKFIGSLVFS